MDLAICFTNFGPYHLARLRALAAALGGSGGRLIAYEVAGVEQRYPWQTAREHEPFDWITFFPDHAKETLPPALCARAIRVALDRDRPDAVAIVGYSRPESMAALGWARHEGRPTILMSESQSIDHPRVWWKEAIKSRRVRRCASAVVGGPSHREYLVDLGMPRDRIALGYNAVDNAHYATQVESARRDPNGRRGLPQRPYFLAVNRFVPEKNLSRLVHAYSRYREAAPMETAWDLVLCGDGPSSGIINAVVSASGYQASIHRPGFLQVDDLSRWYAFASAFVHPSLMEPWGLVVNEAAACGLPLLVSDRAGCAETLVPDGPNSTGRQFDPQDVEGLASQLAWMAGLSTADRLSLGRRAAEIVSCWGPDRFAHGTIEALQIAVVAEEIKEAAFA